MPWPERPERLVFPGLDVARGPVVEQHVAEDVGIGLVDRDRAIRGLTDDGAHFEFEIEAATRQEGGQIVIWRFELAPGTANIGAGDHHRGGATIVADGDMQPVWRQGIFGTAKHCADVYGMVLAGVEIGVFRDQNGQVHLASFCATSMASASE